MHRLCAKCCGMMICIFLLAEAALEMKSVPNLCPESSVCQCKGDASMIDIDCYGIRSLTDAQILLERFQSEIVNHLYLDHCTIDYIPGRAFQNSTIRTIFFKCPLQNVSDEAFADVHGLREIKLFYTNYTRVPKALESSEGIQALSLQFGALKFLENELRNLTNLLFLSLSNNAITSVFEDAFVTLVNLQRLDLSVNALTVLNPDMLDTLRSLDFVDFSENHLSSFDGLLKNLNPSVINIYGNNLSNVDNIFHSNMWKVTEVDMGGNPLSDISSKTFAGRLPELRVLDMREMKLTIPDPDLFQDLPRLQQLNLDYNKMVNISSEVFDNLVSLMVLSLNDNRLISIDGLFETVPHLNELYLTHNNIELLGNALHSMPQLHILDLSFNKIWAILRGDFQNLLNLRRLDLSNNKILWLSPRSFFDLSNLKILVLTSNNISIINGSLRYLPSLAGMFLSYNKIRSINSSELVGLPNLQNCSLFRNQIGSLAGAFRSLPGLVSILLGKNKLVTLSQDTFFDISRLKQMSLQDNKWSCDCRLLWMHNWLSSVNSTLLEDKPRCHLPKRFQNIPIMNLTVEDLVEWPDQCPDPCQCECKPQGIDFYVSVNCSYRGLNLIPQIIPDGTGELNLKGNLLKNLTNFANMSVYSITVLNLEDNIIDTFPVSIPDTINVLLLSRNNLTRFNHTSLGNVSLEEVTLSGNPWICDCQTLDFKRWLLSEIAVVSDVNSTLCGPKQANSALTNRVIVRLTDTELCPPKLSLYISVAVGVLCFLVVATSFGLAYTRNKMRIKVWLYAHGFSFVKEEDLDMDKEFDAFVSYSSLDAEFFVAFKEELQQRMPQMAISSDENFIYGTLILENISNAVKASKRTILILSENFLKSEWCKTEFKAAHQQAMDDKIHRLIIIRYGEIPEDCQVDPTLQEYLDTTTYLKWGEKYFWDKLFYALPKKRRKRQTDIGSINTSERTPLLTG